VLYTAAVVVVASVVGAVTLPESMRNCPAPGQFDAIGPCPDPQIVLRVVLAVGGSLVAIALVLIARRKRRAETRDHPN